MLSQTTVNGRVIAIDAAGAVFLSKDSGKHWQAVHSPWTGRAVLVKERPTAAEAESLKQSTPQFELTTDTPETWTSPDGMIWTLKTNVPK